jgi:hypothetical protein
MGFESVEFVLDLEKALGLSIPDRDVDWRTGREAVAYLCSRMPEVDPGFGTRADISLETPVPNDLPLMSLSWTPIRL